MKGRSFQRSCRKQRQICGLTSKSSEGSVIFSCRSKARNWLVIHDLPKICLPRVRKVQENENDLGRKLKVSAHGSEGGDKMDRTGSWEAILILILEIATMRGSV